MSAVHQAQTAVASPREAIRERALARGFDAVGFAPPALGAAAKGDLAAFLDRGFHGDMGWMADKADRRADPGVLWPEVKSVVVLGLNYGPASDPLAPLNRAGRGAVSAYAWGRDYHRVMKRRLKALAGWMHREFACEVKVFVDTAPVMEKPLAELAGIGWQGKHTNLVSRRYGSWLFLGEVYTTLALQADAPEADYCGSCRRCLDVCPTAAFPAPYRLDARRCISYLTIEHKGHIGREFRRPIGNRIFGCDDCLAVCPWNKFARAAATADFAPRPGLEAPRLAELARLDDRGFRAAFAGSTIKRLGRDRFLRNVLIALGNVGTHREIGVVEDRLADPSPLVRAMAVWALRRLAAPRRVAALKARRRRAEPDPAVLQEWDDEADGPAPRSPAADGSG